MQVFFCCKCEKKVRSEKFELGGDRIDAIYGLKGDFVLKKISLPKAEITH
jgi:uncharacterized lipoprotein YehR (DUF1307 family)